MADKARDEQEREAKVSAVSLNPLHLHSDRHQISPCNINAL